MILEKNDNLRLVNRLCTWLDEKGMTEGYFFEILEEMGLTFPLRISDYIENEDNSFSIVCSTISNDGEQIGYRILFDFDEANPRFVTFCSLHRFWSQPMLL